MLYQLSYFRICFRKSAANILFFFEFRNLIAKKSGKVFSALFNFYARREFVSFLPGKWWSVGQAKGCDWYRMGVLLIPLRPY